jgi:hypothetical protein
MDEDQYIQVPKCEVSGCENLRIVFTKRCYDHAKPKYAGMDALDMLESANT